MKKGYMLVEAMIAIIITGIVATIFTTMSYYTSIQSNMLKQQNTKIILDVIRSRLLDLAKDPDSDSYFELLKQESDNTLPVSVGLGVDAWGKRVFYYTVDLGVHNDVDASYADTSDAISPNDNISGRLVSSGEDMSLETSATDATPQGDDLMLEIGVGEQNHFKLYGGSEITGQTRAYNSAIVSDTQPTNPIDGTLWFDTVSDKLKIYRAGSNDWKDLST
ncbi:MAG: type II secretion system protein [Sulfurimonas sp.]|nr:type II secretion system protein [Sulfurimonas sp.]